MQQRYAPTPGRTSSVRARARAGGRRWRSSSVGAGVGLLLVLLAGVGCTRSEDEGRAAPARPAGGAGGAGGASEPTPVGSSGDGDSDSGGTAADPADPASIAADPSAGCGGVGPDIARPGDETVPIDVGGTARSYLRHVPPGYDGSTPVALIVDFPGYAIDASLEAGISGMAAAGNTAGYVTVTPEALGEPPHWDTRVDSPDVAFVDAVLDDLETELCLDRNRVYVTGFSGGAFMASTLACTLDDRIAAIAPVAGLRDVPGCDPQRPVPVLTFHGTEDTFMPFDGGMGPGLAALPSPDGSGGRLGDALAGDDSLVPGSLDDPVADIAGAWADRNGCEAEPDEGPVADDVTLVEFTCPAGADVELYRVRGGGHTWPGSDGSATFAYVAGETTFSVDATALIWDFFTAHPRPG
jgi:polyhydroxybutyrate depolymerase